MINLAVVTCPIAKPGLDLISPQNPQAVCVLRICGYPNKYQDTDKKKRKWIIGRKLQSPLKHTGSPVSQNLWSTERMWWECGHNGVAYVKHLELSHTLECNYCCWNYLSCDSFNTRRSWKDILTVISLHHHPLYSRLEPQCWKSAVTKPEGICFSS